MNIPEGFPDGFIKICDAGDYRAAYKNHVEYENSFVDQDGNPNPQEIETFDEFCEELKKGYGVSDHIQIARLIETENGIYYDNEYAT